MAKAFHQALKDGYYHIIDSITQDRIKQLRDEGVVIEEGIYTFPFGDRKEYEITIEPLSDEGKYQIGLYKMGVSINEKLVITSNE